MEEVEGFLKGFSACIATSKLYSVTHPQVLKRGDDAYEHLRRILHGKGKIVIAFIENEIFFENRIQFHSSKVLKGLMDLVKKKGIEKFYFYPNVRKEDFINFISFLLSPVEASKNFEQQLRLAGVENIEVGCLMTPDEEKKKNEQSLSPYEIVLTNLSEFYKKLTAEAPDISAMSLELKIIVLNIRDKLVGKYHENLFIYDSKGYSLDDMAALNVGILSVTVAAKMGFEQEAVMDTGIASLLYSMGKSTIEAGDSVREHSLKSAKMLLKYKEYFGTLPVIAAIERYQRGQSMPHIVSMIITFSEYYDAIMRNGETNDQAREKISRFYVEDKVMWAQPQLAGRFFEIIGTPHVSNSSESYFLTTDENP
jgi:hypothetical protein